MTTEELLISTALNSWKTIVGRLDRIVETTDEKKLQTRVAPGRNRVAYLIGHLTVAHDRMFPLLGVGKRLYPQLDEAYFDNPDRSRPEPVTGIELTAAWTDVKRQLTSALERLRPLQWLEKHSDVSDEDFAKDPARHRLAILVSRTNHAAFHTGQIILTK
jgi:hypothetical protein